LAKERPKLDEIARAARVSKATVDRVLNQRPGVQDHTRAHVLAIMAELAGEKSVLAAISKVSLDFILPGGSNAFISDLAHQIERQAAARGDIDLIIHRLQGLEPEEIAKRLADLRGSCTGVGLIGLDSPAVREAVRKLISQGVVVMTLVSDISHVGRVNYVGIDNRAAGRLAGYLIGRFVPGSAGKVALLAGTLAYRGHEEREMGFRHILQESFPQLAIVAAREVREDAERAYRETCALLDEHPDLRAIYCIGAGQDGIARAFIELYRYRSVVFVGHDLTEVTRQYLLSCVLDVALDQNARVEAREAVDRLVRCVRGETDIPSNTVRIQSVFRETIPNES
jgi:LacI family transcriptional regulator